MDKGPVFYEAYYPGTRDAYQKKRYFGGVGNTVLETSFQVPSERFTYSAETADHPISINESFVVVNNEETLPREQRKAIASRRMYDAITTNQFGPFSNERSTIFDDEMNENSQVANIEEISKLVRRAISRELENWNALEGDLDRATHQDRPMPQLGMRPREKHKDSKDGSYMFPVNRGLEDSSLPRKLDAHNGKQRPTSHYEGPDANASTMTSERRVGETRAVDTQRSPIDVISDSLPPENIFQPRPQLIKYVFFKRPVSPQLDQQNEKAIEESVSPGIFGDNLVQFGGEITADNRGRRIEEDVKVTSIEISDVPRHKTRHHHGEWPKRDSSFHRHRSPPANYSMTAL